MQTISSIIKSAVLRIKHGSQIVREAVRSFFVKSCQIRVGEAWSFDKELTPALINSERGTAYGEMMLQMWQQCNGLE